MSDTAEFRIPTFRVTVELVVVGEQPRRADLFVAGQRANGPSRQQVVDVLVSGGDFLPAVADDELHLYNKDALLWVAFDLVGGQIPVEESAPEAEQDLFDVRCLIDVDVQGGHRLSGDLLYSPPPGRTRVADHLNDVQRFFRLWTTSRLFLVNKNHVVRVVERKNSSENA